MLGNILRAYHCHLCKKKNLLFPVVGVEGGGVLESIPLPYYISFTPHLKLVTFGRISFRRSQFSHFQFMYLPYKASKKVILKWIDSFDGEFSHFKNTTYQNLLPHKILEMQPLLQSIQSWKYIRSHPAAHLHEPINRKYFSSGSYYRWTQENFFFYFSFCYLRESQILKYFALSQLN